MTKTSLMRVTKEQGLDMLFKAEAMLEKVQTLPEVRDLVASAEAMQVFIKKAALGISSQNRAAAIATQARKKAGEMLKMVQRTKGGQPWKKVSTPTAASGVEIPTPLQATMKELGISEDTVKQWQRLAEETTNEQIDAAAEQCTKENREFTTAEVLQKKERVSRSLKKLSDEIDANPSHTIFVLFDDIADEIRRFPTPGQAVARLPKSVHHAIDVPTYRKTIKYLSDFCDEWEKAHPKK